MITFSKIRYKNFLSTGQYYTEIDLDATSTTLIYGENGAGKSTLLDALTFALFGKPYRTINKSQLINTINTKECMVELDFTIGPDVYKVCRGLEPAVFEVHKNNELINQEAKSKDYQKLFEDQILRMGYRAFCQVVILGSANYVPFMRLSASERRSVVESLLDINIFSAMNAILKSKQSQSKEDLTILTADLEMVKEKIKLNEKYLKTREDDSGRRLKEIQDDIDKLKHNSVELHSDLNGLLDEIHNKVCNNDHKDAVTKKIQSIEGINRQLKNKSKSIQSEIDFYTTNCVCPTCSQTIEDEFKATVLEEKNKRNKELHIGIGNIQKSLVTEQENLKQISQVLSEIRTIESRISEKKSSISIAESAIARLEKDMVRIKESDKTNNADENELKQLHSQKESVEEYKKETVDDQFYYGIAANLLKDTGIKSRIIKHYIPIINQTVNRYLNQMGMFVSFHLDEEFNESIKSRHRDTFTYASFSEGEKRRIDLALLFAWRKIAALKNSLNANLLIMDEVLDSSLDDEAVDAFLDILKGIDKNTNAFVISHKPKELLESKFTRQIAFIKRNNFSQIV